MFNELKSKYFNGFNNVSAFYDHLKGNMDQKDAQLKSIYGKIYKYLGNWRNNYVLLGIEKMLEGEIIHIDDST